MFDKCYSYNKDSLAQCKTRYLWVLDAHCDYSDFDFSWEPAPWEAHQTHIWPSQHQDNSGTMLIPKQGAEEKNYNHSVVPKHQIVPRLHIKHNPSNPDQGDVNTRYISDYLGTMRRVLRKVDWQYCWVTTDICNYKHFDFTWHPSEYQQDMLHVFSSRKQKFGDTFYVHVPGFLEKTKDLKILEWFETLHFIDAQVPRYGVDYVPYESDSVIDAIWAHEFKNPLAVFSRHEHVVPPTISLWQEQTKTVVPLIKGGSGALVPREAKNYLKTQLYDYPYIDKTYAKTDTNPQDIVFISYDEVEAEKNYQILLELTKGLPNRVHRVHGVEGMQNALKAASAKAITPWSYHVFAKTEVCSKFKFNYAPDYFQVPKHYIFYAQNMSNDLVYGEMGIILYNNKMVIESPDYSELGLDFTMSFPIEVVPELSCFGRFATSPYQAWRTAFRETSKIAYFNHERPSMEGKHRLHVWTTKAHGDYADWVLKGANDGVAHFNNTGSVLHKLKSTVNDWDWLRSYYDLKYSVKESTT
jgi:hypothetical protein